MQEPDEIKRHPFFKGIDWDKLSQKLVTPPYKPPVVRIHSYIIIRQPIGCTDKNSISERQVER
jgi:hypothetical protein